MNLWESIVYDLPDDKRSIFYIIIFHFTNPKYRILKTYRLAKYFGSSKYKFFRLYAQRLNFSMIRKGGCDIHISCEIGKNIKLAHPIGIVIGAGVIIYDSVTIFQNVTLGSHGSESKSQKEYPIIARNVIIYAGSTLVGGIKIGENSIIGANSFINKDVPPGYIAYGNPMKLKKKQ
jgi:serine O-acetyltransferase